VVYGVCNARVLSSNIAHAFEFSFREIYNKKFRYRKKNIAHRRYRQDKKSRYKNCILKCLHFKMFAKSENSFKVIGKTIPQVR